VTITGLAITGGAVTDPRGQGFGGGIENRGTLTLVDVVVRRNHAYDGAGIFNAGSLRLVRSTLSHHGSGDQGSIQGSGGGLYNTGIATLARSTVSDNVTDYGGAGIVNIGTLTLRRSFVVRNESDFGAPGGLGPGSGGIVNHGRLILVRSVVSENRGYKGGGIGSTGKVVLVTSRVTDNMGLGPGGGIANFGGRVVLRELSRVEGNTSESALPGPGGGGVFNRGRLILRDSSITGNTSTTDPGGGIYNAGDGTVVLRGTSSVTGNTPDDCVGTPAC
jgi:hypothetical protein